MSSMQNDIGEAGFCWRIELPAHVFNVEQVAVALSSQEALAGNVEGSFPLVRGVEQRYREAQSGYGFHTFRS